MGQCSFSGQVEAEEFQSAGSSGGKRMEQLPETGASYMKLPYHASTKEQLVLMVSLDSITRIA